MGVAMQEAGKHPGFSSWLNLRKRKTQLIANSRVAGGRGAISCGLLHPTL